MNKENTTFDGNRNNIQYIYNISSNYNAIQEYVEKEKQLQSEYIRVSVVKFLVRSRMITMPVNITNSSDDIFSVFTPDPNIGIERIIVKVSDEFEDMFAFKQKLSTEDNKVCYIQICKDYDVQNKILKIMCTDIITLMESNVILLNLCSIVSTLKLNHKLYCCNLPNKYLETITKSKNMDEFDLCIVKVISEATMFEVPALLNNDPYNTDISIDHKEYVKNTDLVICAVTRQSEFLRSLDVDYLSTLYIRSKIHNISLRGSAHIVISSFRVHVGILL